VPRLRFLDGARPDRDGSSGVGISQRHGTPQAGRQRGVGGGTESPRRPAAKRRENFWALGVENRALGVQNRALGVQNRALGVQNRALGVQNRALGV